MDEHVRGNLAADQARLVAALTSDAPIPDGFDGGRLQLSRRSLMQKRVRAVAKVWPALAHAREDFAATFAEYARHHPTPTGGARDDALGYAQDLARRKLLPARWRWRLFFLHCTVHFKLRR